MTARSPFRYEYNFFTVVNKFESVFFTSWEENDDHVCRPSLTLQNIELLFVSAKMVIDVESDPPSKLCSLIFLFYFVLLMLFYIFN